MTEEKHIRLKGLKVTLRAPRNEDVEERLRLGNDFHIFQMFGMSAEDVRPLTREGANEWVQQIADHPHAWIIEANGKLVGLIRLDRLDRRDRRASMAVGVYDPEMLGKGLGSEAIRLVLHYAFSDLDLHRISLRVLSYNERAIKAYRKCGFVVEGREREAGWVNGAWHDDVMMGVLAHEAVLQAPMPEDDMPK